MRPSDAVADVIVRTSFVALHRWPLAPSRRSYLRSHHRHKFEVEVRVPVTHEEREVEFHDLLEAVNAKCIELTGEASDKSCETMAREVANAMREKFHRPWCVTSVFEDGECGAEVRVEG